MAELIDGDIVEIDREVPKPVEKILELHPQVDLSILEGLSELEKYIIAGISNSAYDVPHSVMSDLCDAKTGYTNRNHLSFVVYEAMRHTGGFENFSYEEMMKYVDDTGTRPEEFDNAYLETLKSCVKQHRIVIDDHQHTTDLVNDSGCEAWFENNTIVRINPKYVRQMDEEKLAPYLEGLLKILTQTFGSDDILDGSFGDIDINDYHYIGGSGVFLLDLSEKFKGIGLREKSVQYIKDLAREEFRSNLEFIESGALHDVPEYFLDLANVLQHTEPYFPQLYSEAVNRLKESGVDDRVRNLTPEDCDDSKTFSDSRMNYLRNIFGIE